MMWIKLTAQEAGLVNSLVFAKGCRLQATLCLEGYWVLPASVVADEDYHSAWGYLEGLEQTDAASWAEDEI